MYFSNSNNNFLDFIDVDIKALKEEYADQYEVDYYFPYGDILVVGRDRKKVSIIKFYNNNIFQILISLLHAAVTSDFFAVAVSPRFSESRKKMVIIPDFNAIEIVDAFELNNYVLYKWLEDKNNHNINFDHMKLDCIFNVMKIASYLQMEYLLEVLTNHILKKISTLELVKAFRDSKGLDGHLAKELWKKILKHFDEIYCNRTFLQLEEKELLDCIKDPTVNLLWTKDKDVLYNYIRVCGYYIHQVFN